MTTIRIARTEGYEISPRGVTQFYPQGDYSIPDQMPPDTARRCLDSGIGVAIRGKGELENKLAPAPSQSKKKKRSTVKRGRRATSSPPAQA